jgi:hypothetical protein
MSSLFTVLGRRRAAGRRTLGGWKPDARRQANRSRQLRLEALEGRMLLSVGASTEVQAAAASVPAVAVHAPGDVTSLSNGASSVALAAVVHGTSTIGLYDPTTGTFFLRNSNTSGFADIVCSFGPPGNSWTPITGDWDGNGTDTIGLYNPTNSTFYLRNSNTSGFADMVFMYGSANGFNKPITGDWEASGTDTIGLYNQTNSTFYLRNSNDSGFANVTFLFGPPGAGWTPMAGDWKTTGNDGSDTTGLHNPATATFYLRNSNTTGAADVTFPYGQPSAWKPLSGDWTGSGTDTVGLYNIYTSVFYLKNTNSGGYANLTFAYGPSGSGWLPVVGDWDGPSPLQAVGQAGSAADVPALTLAELQPIAREAVARWTSAGLDAVDVAKLAQVQFVIGDLPGSYLGEAGANRIYVDRDAAGRGWFVDPTPARDEEFAASPSGRTLRAVDPRAVDQIDLLTVVEHELGHIAGFADLNGLADNLMSGVLGVGVRRNPGPDRVVLTSA